LGSSSPTPSPDNPEGRGKIERFFRTVREQFLIELAVPGALAKVDGLAGLNELFTAWVETVYHQRVHSETAQTPLDRFTTSDPPVLPTPTQLREAFLWSEHRQVAKTATVSLHGNTYEVDAALVGRRVELVFDPLDLTELSVRYQGREMGTAIPHRIGRHVHPAAKAETGPVPAPVTGIDYLGLVRDRHTTALTQRVNYAGLTRPTAAEDLDSGLEAELASFAALVATSTVEESHHDQLDLLELLDPTNPDSDFQEPQ
jgi:putative transposase